MLNGASNINISKGAKIHETVIFISGSINIEDGVEIGPYCVLNGNITLKRNVKLLNHINIAGNTEIGEGTILSPFASIGSEPQDLKYKGEDSFLVIGKNNIIREYVTISPGTKHGGLYTKIGDGNLFMIGSHIGHDCKVGNSCVIANNVSIAGHVIIEDSVTIGGNSAVHQFVRIGKNSMVGGVSGVVADIPPFTLYMGIRLYKIRGLNMIGLKRNGFTNEDIKKIKESYEFIFTKEENFYHQATILSAKNKDDKVKTILDFILAEKDRPICKWDSNNKLSDE